MKSNFHDITVWLDISIPEGIVEGETKQKWDKLCTLAETEQDGEKFTEIIQEINRMLNEKQSRLNRNRSNQATAHRTHNIANVNR
jgi:hypothetical protein